MLARRFLLAALAYLLVACGGGGQSPENAAVTKEYEARGKEVFTPSFLPAVYRFAKISTGAYFYTGSDEEAATIIRSYPDFRYEGVAFERDPLTIGKPVYRFANLNNGGYFYTGSVEERDQVIAAYSNMRYEGTTFAVANRFESFAQPVYRLANLTNGAYLFTTSAVERDYAVSLGIWRSEGSTFSAPVPVPETYKATAAILAARKFAPSLTFDSSEYKSIGRLIGRGCENVINPIVYEQAHTIVFAGQGVTEIDQQEVAQYAEEAALEIRAIYAAPADSVGFNGRKVNVCVQNESATDGLFAMALRGKVVMQSASGTYSNGSFRDSKADNISYWRAVRRTLVHEIDHAYLYSLVEPSTAVADKWFVEGNAHYVELGKPALSKAALLADVAKQNPLDGLSNTGFVHPYDPPAAVMFYLFSPSGANNRQSAIAQMSLKMKEIRDQFEAQCLSSQLPRATCVANPAIQYHAGFIAAFESIFKEADGTPMKLYTGVNNLHDTIAQRLEKFW